MIVLEQITKNGIKTRIPVTSIGVREQKMARSKFEVLKKDGVILSDYDDDFWKLTCQTKTVGIMFHKDASEFDKAVSSAGRDPDKLRDDIKVFTVLKLNRVDLRELQASIHYIFRQVVVTKCFTEGLPEKCMPARLAYLNDFIQVIGVEKGYIKKCDDKLRVLRAQQEIEKKGKKARSLPEFVSLYKFNDILKDFWGSASLNEKMRFYPVYLFWIITSVIPLRVTEFCVTPYDCLKYEGGCYKLKIRRSKLKGRSADGLKIHGYSIRKDYKEYFYEIPEWLYLEIDKYRQASRDYEHPFELLFSYRMQKEYDKTIISKSSGFFDGYCLNSLIFNFYSDVAIGRLGLSIIDEDFLEERSSLDEDASYEMTDDEIMLVHAGDTRHIAMINLIMRGCNPMLIKEFAGQTNDITSAHYYGNTSNLVRSVVKYYYDKKKAEKEMSADVSEISAYNPLTVLIDENSERVEVGDGWCHSKKFINGISEDCALCDGDCDRCEHHELAHRASYSDRVSKKAMQVDAEMEYVTRMLTSTEIEARIEEFQEKTLELESHMKSFASEIWREYKEEQDGKRKKEKS